MTTSETTARISQAKGRFRLPDIPQREPDEVTQYDHLFHNGLSAALFFHLGAPETTLVAADRWVVPDTQFNKTRGRYPDLMVAFGVDPELYRDSNGYIVSEQGKPPDFVLEVASESTAEADVGVKRQYYESLGVLEYWRFDPTPDGKWHGAKLSGDRLVDGEYVAIEIVELPDGSLQGYSTTLNVHLRWIEGELAFYDPATGQHIATFDSERERADNAEAERNAEREARREAQARADNAEAERNAAKEARREAQVRADNAEAERNAERSRAEAAEARVRELEEQLHSRGTEGKAP